MVAASLGLVVRPKGPEAEGNPVIGVVPSGVEAIDGGWKRKGKAEEALKEKSKL